MVRQLLRLGWFLVLLWLLVLGLRQGSLRSIIAPLFVIGVVYVLQEYADRHLPAGFSSKWRVSLLFLMALFSLRTTVWPWIAHHSQATRIGIRQVLDGVDVKTSLQIDSCPMAALQAMNDFRGEWNDREGRDVKKEFQRLITKKNIGVFTESDQRQLTEVFARVQRLVDQNNQVRAMIQKLCPDEMLATGAKGRVLASDSLPVSPGQTGEAIVASAANVSPNHAHRGEVSSPRAGGTGGSTFAGVPISFNREPTIVRGKINTALVIDAPLGPDGFAPSDALYGLIRTPSTNVVLNLLDEQRFKSSGAFAQTYGGDTRLFRDARALAKVDYLVLAKVTFSFTGSPEIDQDLRSCRLTFGYKTFDRNANLIKANSLTAVGAGLSEVSALKTAIERLAQSHSSAILEGQ